MNKTKCFRPAKYQPISFREQNQYNRLVTCVRTPLKIPTYRIYSQFPCSELAQTYNLLTLKLKLGIEKRLLATVRSRI